jgi:hypothetical protein
MDFRKHYFPAGAYLFLLLIFSGCGDRELARPTPQMDAPEQFWIRVLLFDNIRGCALKISSPFSVLDGGSAAIEGRFEGIGAPTSINLSAGRISIGGRPSKSGQVDVLPESPHVFELNGRAYRGKLKLIVNTDGNSFDAINIVSLEPYLAGVVGAEMPDYWEPTALQAQAVAARTYCLYIKRRFGDKRAWDVRRTQANQVYRGVGAESGQVWEAVNKTSGQVLVCSHADGGEKIFPAYYSSACGGHTENSRRGVSLL